LKGIVTKSTGSWLMVKGDDGVIVPCKIKGKFRIKGIKTTNPVAVGDKVIFHLLDDGKAGLITDIEQRKNYIIRKSIKLSKVSQIIAANIDQLLLMVSMALPKTSRGFIDRFLVTSEAYHIPAILLFNKYDIYNEQEMTELEDTLEVYRAAGYRCLVMSAAAEYGFDELKELLQGKISLISGNSGVGKSTMINKLEPGLDIRTLEVSAYHEKGQHATTFAEMHELSIGGSIIDTPGIREFGLIDFDKKEVAERFPEFRKLMHDCKYNNCIHINEPGCAVKKGLEDGTIARSRYESYLKIYYGDDWEEIEKKSI
jgi:ribosome biogenesis GTPase